MACGAVAAAAAAAAAVVGGSLLNTTIEEISKQIRTDRNISIQLSNFSHKYILTNPRVFTSSGYSHNPPQPTIQKRTIEACSFTKTAGTACGAVGVLTYEICRHEDKHWVGELMIMFSVPYDYNLYENWFALGISKDRISCNEQLFHQMYYDNGSFTRAKSTGSEIKFLGKHAYVKGTMSPAGRSIMKVEFWDLETHQNYPYDPNYIMIK
ncbi:DELTA-stichotoxin-Hcr4a-like [Astyanax mexicanus]|uniref:DELTA-stichotoxin-Hcr4a-like n=1 Tax=Astyanax mexicanus TaxID=7994 RepID=A0A8T2L9G5_ASTMX|nr:DELTA-stichotoxin-Hcr4a-like [Astyanax mexicanus]